MSLITVTFFLQKLTTILMYYIHCITNNKYAGEFLQYLGGETCLQVHNRKILQRVKLQTVQLPLTIQEVHLIGQKLAVEVVASQVLGVLIKSKIIIDRTLHKVAIAPQRLIQIEQKAL